MKTLKERLVIFKTIFPYISKYKFQWILLFFLKIGQKSPLLFYPIILKNFIDMVADKKNLSYMLVIVVMYIGVFLLETILKVFHRVIDNSLFNKITYDLRIIVFDKYIQMPMEHFRKYQISDIVRRLNFDIDMVKFFLIGQVYDYISYIGLIILSFIMMFTFDYHLAIIACILLPLSLYLSGNFEDKLEQISEKERKIQSELEELVEEISSNWKEVKANHLEGYQEQKFEHVLLKFLNCKCSNADIQFKRNMALDTKRIIIDLLAMYVSGGILNVLYGVAAGTIIASIGYYDNILQSAREIMQININLKCIKPSINRVLEILNFPIESRYRVKTDEGNLNIVYELNNINFMYDNSDKDLIHQFSFTIYSGEKVLLGGGSGSGKSTLMQIMAGEITSQKGGLLFRGIDIKGFSEHDIYRYIRKIDQNTYFMNISVKEFLQMAKVDASLEELEEACKEVNLWDYLEIISPDLEYVIGENGSNLSKGLKQKLALARIFLSQNKVIMLDDAFSAIDVADKIQIINRLFDKFNNYTIICAAHDKEIIERFEKIMEVNN